MISYFYNAILDHESIVNCISFFALLISISVPIKNNLELSFYGGLTILSFVMICLSLFVNVLEKGF